MKTQKWLIPLGMIGVFSFLALTTLGRILWPGYNPVTTYVSVLIANGAPNAHFMRIFMNLYNICFCIFALAMAACPFRGHNICVRSGYILLFIISFLSLMGYGACPGNLEFIFSPHDIIHLVITILILCSAVLAVLLISVGYMKQERFKALGRVTLTIWTLFTLLNLWHLFAIMHGQNILGLIQRLIFYTFHAFIFIISWIYTFKREAFRL